MEDDYEDDMAEDDQKVNDQAEIDLQDGEKEKEDVESSKGSAWPSESGLTPHQTTF